jgi:predicted nucleic acid-binding protein
MVLVDTSAWIEFFRKEGDLAVKMAVANLRQEMMAAICGPVEMEFLGGARSQDRAVFERDFARLPYVRNGHLIWKDTATHYAKLREHAVTAPWNDIIIATICVNASCRLYAVDRHFQLMAPILGLRLYQPGTNGSYQPDSH